MGFSSSFPSFSGGFDTSCDLFSSSPDVSNLFSDFSSALQTNLAVLGTSFTFSSDVLNPFRTLPFLLLSRIGPFFGILSVFQTLRILFGLFPLQTDLPLFRAFLVLLQTFERFSGLPPCYSIVFETFPVL